MNNEIGFSTNRNEGFHVTFANGVTASVQFHEMSYCARKGKSLGEGEKSPDAEVAAWDSLGNWITGKYVSEVLNETSDDVLGYQSPEDVLKFLNWAQNYRS